MRPWLFQWDSETIHDRTLDALGRVSRQPILCEMCRSVWQSPSLPTEVFGLQFPNPVGLAAGMDKRGAAVPIWASLGFGFSELGGVTWHAQPGNPAPRMFRAISDGALVNRMGFNNPGAEVMAQTLRNWRASGQWPAHPVGINLGKSKITPLEAAAGDYARSFERLRDLADFFVINVSSPNTPNLRQLQDKTALDEIFAAIQELNQPSLTATASPQPRPILVKVAPDLTFEALDDILDLVSTRRIAGLVATNTTITRPLSEDPDLQRTYQEAGGLSGRPLRERSTEVVRHVYRQSRGQLPIVGVGGIFTAEDAWEKITAGASLVQVYTGLVYEGPAVAGDIVAGLQERLQREGMKDLRQAVGTGNR